MATFKVTTTFKLENVVVMRNEKEFTNPKQAVEFVTNRRAEVNKVLPNAKVMEGTRGFVARTEKASLIVKVERVEDQAEELLLALASILAMVQLHQAVRALPVGVVGVVLALPAPEN